MMVCVSVKGDQLQFMVDGGDETMAIQLLTAAAEAIRQKMAAEGRPVVPPAPATPPRPPLYLPNGHGYVPEPR